MVEDRIRERLHVLSKWLGEAEWLDGAFSAGDLMMISVLLCLKSAGLLDGFARLSAYVGRGEARRSLRSIRKCSTYTTAATSLHSEVFLTESRVLPRQRWRNL